MNLWYWLSVDFALAGRWYGLGAVIAAIIAPFLIGGGLFALVVKLSGDRI